MPDVVTVCIATFRRPEGIRRLLQSLAALDLGPDGSDVPDVQVVVVDNDPAASALEALGPSPTGYRWPTTVLQEPVRGIPQARNRGVQVAVARGGYVAFVDDDEEVDRRWLTELLTVARRYDAAAVAGPVVPTLPDGTPTWVVRGRFFDRPRHETGAPVEHFATNNALLRTAVVEQLGGFDERLALTGGSDRELSDRVVAAGHVIRWADDAVVYESVPRDRVTLRWLLHRAWRLGNNIGARARMPGIGSSRAVMSAASVAVLRLGYGIGVTLSGTLRGAHVAAAGLRTVAAALGTLAGIAGLTYEEYARSG